MRWTHFRKQMVASLGLCVALTAVSPLAGGPSAAVRPTSLSGVATAPTGVALQARPATPPAARPSVRIALGDL